MPLDDSPTTTVLATWTMIQCHEYIANQRVTTLTEREQSVQYIVRNDRHISRISERWLSSNRRCVLRPYIHILLSENVGESRKDVDNLGQSAHGIHIQLVYSLYVQPDQVSIETNSYTHRCVLAIHRYVRVATRAKRRLNTRSRLEISFSIMPFRAFIRSCSSTERQRASEAQSKPISNFPVTMDLTYTIRRSIAPWTNEDCLYVVSWFPAGRCPSPGMFVECVT